MNAKQTLALATLALAAVAPAQTMEERVAKLEYLVSMQQAQIKTLMTRTQYMSVSNGDTFFVGTNVRIQKDATPGNTKKNGKGNLIVGYNLARTDANPTIRDGSHNIVFGEEASYFGMNGLVGGFRNSVMTDYGAILSGALNRVAPTNTAQCRFNVILSGQGNTVQGEYGTIMSGWSNYMSGSFNMIGTGKYNAVNEIDGVTPVYSTVLTGDSNRARYTCSAVVTGRKMEANAHGAAVLTCDGVAYNGLTSNDHSWGSVSNGKSILFPSQIWGIYW